MELEDWEETEADREGQTEGLRGTARDTDRQ